MKRFGRKQRDYVFRNRTGQGGRSDMVLGPGGYITLDFPVTIRIDGPYRFTLLPADVDVGADIDRQVSAKYGLIRKDQTP